MMPAPHLTSTPLPVLSPNQHAVIREARKLIGIRWRHQGRNPDRGLDCGGVPDIIATRLGWAHQPIRAYSRYPDGWSLKAYLREEMIEIPRPLLQPADLLLFLNIIPGTWPCHVGIVADCPERLTIIHGDAIEERVVEHGLNETWYAKIAGCFRFREVAQEVGPWRN